MWAHLFVVILLNDRPSDDDIHSISSDNMIEFFEDMLDTLDSAERCGKEDIRMLQIRLIFISFKV